MRELNSYKGIINPIVIYCMLLLFSCNDSNKTEKADTDTSSINHVRYDSVHIDNSHKLFNLGVYQLDNNKPEEAIISFNKAAQKKEIPIDSINYYTSLALYQMGNLVEASIYLKNAIKVNPRPEYYSTMSLIYTDLNMDDSAKKYLNTALAMGDSSVLEYFKSKQK